MRSFPPDTWSEYTWWARRRPDQQMPPGDWRIWLILAGRGWGKTRTGAEAVRERVQLHEGSHIALVGETDADVRNVMVEGPDGILNRCHPAERPRYEPSKRRLTWPNGAVATTYSGADPEQLRGPQHGFAWVDELAKFTYARDTWDNLMLGLRGGADPRCIVTTTPRPLHLLRSILAREGEDVTVTRGSTYDNSLYLPEPFLREIVRKYEGTTLGRQELYAEVLDETPGAIWTRKVIEEHRVSAAPKLARIAVGVDPSTTEHGTGDACGIVVAGITAGAEPHAYVLADFTLNAGPKQWADAVARAYRAYDAHVVVVEGNQGGGMVRQVLETAHRTMNLNIVSAKRSKSARAERIQVLYERGLVHHAGALSALEDEMVNWVPGRASPNRMDALVWALARLMPTFAAEVHAELM